MSVLNRKLREFFTTEAAGGIFLVGAALLALILANSPAQKIYFDITQKSHLFVNEILMSVFFFLVGLEIKREFKDGELSNPKKAALPVIAALGGMIIPVSAFRRVRALLRPLKYPLIEKPAEFNRELFCCVFRYD